MGVVGLALAMLIMILLGSFWADANGVRFGLFGGLIWVTALVMAFLFGLIFFAQFVLPVKGNEGWSEGLNLIWNNYTRLGDLYLKNVGKSEPKRRRRKKEADAAPQDPNQPPPSFNDVRAGFLFSHQVMSLAKGAGFSRAAGPGFVRLYRGELIRQILDLRPHLRRTAFRANTRDGIPIETSVSVLFHIKPDPLDEEDDAIPYAYDKDAVFRASYANSIDEKERLQPWTEQIVPQAVTLLTNELARYTLDQLYADYAPPLETIKLEVKRQLEPLAEQIGIELLNVDVGHFTLPDKIAAQRIRTWQSRWEQNIHVHRAQGDAEAIRRIKKARARVQVEIIENITQNIEAMRQLDAASLDEIVMLRMIQVLEEAMSDASVKALIPEQIMANLVLDASNQMRSWVGEGGGEGGR